MTPIPDAGMILPKMVNHRIQHRLDDGEHQQDNPETVDSIQSYLNNTTRDNNVTENYVISYFNNVTTNTFSACDKKIKILLDSGANFFAYHPKDPQM